jgi:hypothetical protein
LQCLGPSRDRRQVGVAQGELRLEGGEHLPHLALLSQQRAELLLLPSLLLLDLRQPIRERARIIRLCWNGGDEQQQRRQGAGR